MTKQSPEFLKYKGKIQKIKEQGNKQGMEIEKKGGIRSQQVQKEKKIIKEEILKMMGEDDWVEYIRGIIDRSKKDTKSAEFMRDTLGQKPVDKQEIKNKLEIEKQPISETELKILWKKYKDK